jgi:hypothetical protein
LRLFGYQQQVLTIKTRGMSPLADRRGERCARTKCDGLEASRGLTPLENPLSDALTRVDFLNVGTLRIDPHCEPNGPVPDVLSEANGNQSQRGVECP